MKVASFSTKRPKAKIWMTGQQFVLSMRDKSVSTFIKKEFYMHSIALFNPLAVCFILFFLSSTNTAYANTENPPMLSLTQGRAITPPILTYTTLAHTKLNLPVLKKCIKDKYHHYTQASISWYESLTKAVITKDPKLTEVASLFLNNRKKYAIFNLTVFSYYLNHSPEKLDLSASVESWLNLDQEKLEHSQGLDPALTPLATELHALKEKDRHKNNYKLRTAFAELLSKPANMQAALNTYNLQLQAINQIPCNKE